MVAPALSREDEPPQAAADAGAGDTASAPLGVSEGAALVAPVAADDAMMSAVLSRAKSAGGGKGRRRTMQRRGSSAAEADSKSESWTDAQIETGH